jgi:GTP-binding protein
MKTYQARLLTDAPHPRAFPPPDLPELAVVGRSNVGKSTLINSLVGIHSLARVSRTPGRTRSLVFFEIERRFLLVDLPGYGFAKAPRDESQRWRELVQAYLEASRPLRGVLALFDLRRDPDELDQALLSLFAHYQIRWLPVWTKADKIAPRDLVRRAQAMDRALCCPRPGIAFSARTRQGREELWAWVEAQLL